MPTATRRCTTPPSRGDTEMIRYLVSKGADVKKVNRAGQTTIDVANGPVQRTQPYPGDDQAAREPGRDQQPQVRELLGPQECKGPSPSEASTPKASPSSRRVNA